MMPTRFFMDIVYHPWQTKLLQEAQERGCQTIHGLEMLARQGAAQLEIWTGKRQAVGQIKEDLHIVLKADVNSSGETHDRDQAAQTM
jgi:shikimate dehydrogenase